MFNIFFDNWLFFFLFSLGIFIYFLSIRFKYPFSIILIFLGIFFKNFSFNGYNIEPYYFLFNLSILIIILIIFVLLNEFSFHELDLYGEKGFKITIINYIINILFFTFFINIFFNFKLIYSFLISVILSSTDYSVYNHLVKNNRYLEFLKYESIFGTIFMIILSFIIFSFFKFDLQNLDSSFLSFLSQNLLGISIGLIIAIVFFSFFKKFSNWLTDIFVFIGLIFSYIIAEFLKANPIFSVVVYSLLFERLTYKRKKEVNKFIKFISYLSSSFIFIILGFLLSKYTYPFVLSVLFLFLIYLVLRFFSLFIALFGFHNNFKDFLFMTLNCPKGIDVIALSIIIKFIIPELFDLLIVFILFSLLSSNFAVYFLRNKN